MRWWGPILSCARGDLRRRGRAWLALALLLGLSAGLVLAAWAGARRTTTAFPRLQEATNSFDVLANPDDGDMDFARIEALPAVADAGRIAGVVALPVGPDGQPSLEFDTVVFAPLDDRAMVTLHERRILEGRDPDPTAPDEALITEQLAESGAYEVGDRVELAVFGEEELAALEEGADPSQLPAGTRATVEIVGVGFTSDDALVPPDDRLGAIEVTHAFTERYHPAPIFTGDYLRLTGGEDAVASFVAEAQRVDGEDQVFYQTKPALTAKAERAVRPYVGALAGFALVGAIATALVIGQALVRQILLDSNDFPIQSSLGMTRSQLLAGVLLRAAVTAVVGAVLALGIAVALSPLAPIGPVRDVEPDPGLALDGFALGLGAVAILLLPLLVTVGPAWFATSTARRVAGDAQRRPSALAQSLLQAGASLVASTGIRMAFERGRGRTAVPVQATLAGTALSVGVLATALVFGNSLDHLLSTPRLYGGTWDATIDFGAAGGEGDLSLVHDLGDDLADDTDVLGVSVGGQGQVTVNGDPVPAIGLRPVKGDVELAVVEGRAAAADHEVVLGTNTLRALGASVGDEVLIGVEGEPAPFRVVGRGVFPLFAAYPGADKLGLGDGVALTLDALFDLVPGAYESFVLLDLGGDQAVFRRIHEENAETLRAEQGDDLAGFTAPEQPEDIVGYDRVDVVPYALAGLLLLLAGGTTAHALVTGIRRRRRDLAVLKTVGFDRRQVAGVVAWQATSLAVVGIAIGLPLGLAAGWSVWRWLADRIGAVPEPMIEALPVVLVAVAALLVTNAVAFVPARRISRASAAPILRAE